VPLQIHRMCRRASALWVGAEVNQRVPVATPVAAHPVGESAIHPNDAVMRVHDMDAILGLRLVISVNRLRVSSIPTQLNQMQITRHIQATDRI